MSTDYVSDNLSVPDLAPLFPNMIVGAKGAVTWPYFRKEIDHTWYVDRRNPQIGFINKDEAAILYSNARLFSGRRGLEIGAWRGWSTCHLLASGPASLHVVEPLLADPDWRREFAAALEGAGEADRAILVPGRVRAKSSVSARQVAAGRSFSSTGITTGRRRRPTRSLARVISSLPR